MQVKRLSDILTGLKSYTVTRTDEINDFTPGSVLQSIYEAIAMELESYYMLQEENINWGLNKEYLIPLALAGVKLLVLMVILN